MCCTDFVVKCLFLLISITSVTSNTCRPCDGSRPYTIKESEPTCNHRIKSKELMISHFKDIVNDIKTLTDQRKNVANPVSGVKIETCDIRLPLDELKRKLPRRHKTRFVHETYANLSFAHDLLEEISSISSDLHTHSQQVKTKLMSAMCDMYKLNQKLHCKNSNKMSKKANKILTACKSRRRIQCDLNKLNTSEGINLQFEVLDHIATIVDEIVTYWDTCIQKKLQKGRLVDSKKCRKIKRKSKNKKDKKKNRRRRKNRKGKQQRKRNKKQLRKQS